MKKGFTLVEIMIVVGIIAVIASIAIPSFINAGAKARKNGCIANLSQINAAKEQYAMDYSLQNGASVTEAQINGYLGSIVPACPGAGTYTYGTIGTYPTCTLNSQGHTIE
ncbi:MAG: prepilin-type N-terminal cleavage/methylation domain-containing protein [Candidatus Omnitrophica bacterium]|nr:prepilin-type N-terminal cleavage/methylation domain-containing protein [Candidatus Omnitrophota bacterium]